MLLVLFMNYLNKIVWKIFNVYNYYCKYRLNKLLPGLQSVIDDYNSKSETTGTKYSSLYKAVKIILHKRPEWILELGTGTSTLVFAETILHIQKLYPNYHGKIVSMESVEKYYIMAKNLLPKKYFKVVDIQKGERELYEYSMFRGYAHSNIPHHNYNFIFVDGPSYLDEKGTSTCMDAIKIRLQSDEKLISCVVDTRVSTVWMMQKIFSIKTIKYFPIFRTCYFNMPKININPKLDSSSFSSTLTGRLRLNIHNQDK